ncbi:hypothetical protein AB205_0096150, partial [Aquarana catesbeiana]
GEELKDIKVEVKMEKEEMLGDQQSMEEDGGDVRNTSERPLLLLLCYSNAITKDPLEGNSNTHHRPSCPETSMDPSDQGESSHQSHTMIVNIHVRSHTADRSTVPSNPEESSSPHKGDHRGQNLFSCSECGKSFTYRSSLVKHQRVHTGERPYSCSKCRKSFTFKGNLVRHHRIHTGARSYSCSECGKSFTHKGVLVRHKRIHTGEHPYSCLECGKSFTYKNPLVEHQRIHTGERFYSCSDCG